MRPVFAFLRRVLYPQEKRILGIEVRWRAHMAGADAWVDHIGAALVLMSEAYPKGLERLRRHLPVITLTDEPGPAVSRIWGSIDVCVKQLESVARAFHIEPARLAACALVGEATYARLVALGVDYRRGPSGVLRAIVVAVREQGRFATRLQDPVLEQFVERRRRWADDRPPEHLPATHAAMLARLHEMGWPAWLVRVLAVYVRFKHWAFWSRRD